MPKIYLWDSSIGHNGYYNGSYCWQNGIANSSGGWSIVWSFKNNTGKTIKYAHFWFVPYNAVGDPVCCRIRRVSLDGIRVTGPISSGEFRKGLIWENAWYNTDIRRVNLSHVYLEYMDGTAEKISGGDISFEKPEGTGCYIATAVYGSYNCPQVWTLRRYRDYTLSKTWYGRAFIKTYYAISPTLVKWFGDTTWFKIMWRGKLDSMVEKLEAKGIESTPYEDKIW